MTLHDHLAEAISNTFSQNKHFVINNSILHKGRQANLQNFHKILIEVLNTGVCDTKENTNTSYIKNSSKRHQDRLIVFEFDNNSPLYDLIEKFITMSDIIRTNDTSLNPSVFTLYARRNTVFVKAHIDEFIFIGEEGYNEKLYLVFNIKAFEKINKCIPRNTVINGFIKQLYRTKSYTYNTGLVINSYENIINIVTFLDYLKDKLEDKDETSC